MRTIYYVGAVPVASVTALSTNPTPTPGPTIIEVVQLAAALGKGAIVHPIQSTRNIPAVNWPTYLAPLAVGAAVHFFTHFSWKVAVAAGVGAMPVSLLLGAWCLLMCQKMAVVPPPLPIGMSMPLGTPAPASPPTPAVRQPTPIY